MPEDGLFCYEQPLNERIRTFLRVEHLTSQLHHHRADPSVWGRRATMTLLLDILNVMSRHDIRGQVHKELNQRHENLSTLAERDDVNHDTLDNLLSEIAEIGAEMTQIPPRFAAYLLRDNELLNSINNRHAIPGGTCSFDLPSFHHWLAQSDERIDADLTQWLDQIIPIERGVRVMLQILRESTQSTLETADNGVLVHKTVPGTQLIRVLLDNANIFPEISGGRHRVTIRLMQYQDAQMHTRQTDHDLQFQMACCRF